jgi:hypothetical protein
VPSVVRPALVVQAVRSPVSKPSKNSGAVAAVVVARTGALSGETLPPVSRARTV